MSVQPPHAKPLTANGGRLHTVLSIGMQAGGEEGSSSTLTLQDVSDLSILFFMRDEVGKMADELDLAPLWNSIGAAAQRRAQYNAFMDEWKKIDKQINEVALSDLSLDVEKKRAEGRTIAPSDVPDYARRLLEDIRERAMATPYQNDDHWDDGGPPIYW